MDTSTELASEASQWRPFVVIPTSWVSDLQSTIHMCYSNLVWQHERDVHYTCWACGTSQKPGSAGDTYVNAPGQANALYP